MTERLRRPVPPEPHRHLATAAATATAPSRPAAQERPPVPRPGTSGQQHGTGGTAPAQRSRRAAPRRV